MRKFIASLMLILFLSFGAGDANLVETNQVVTSQISNSANPSLLTTGPKGLANLTGYNPAYRVSF